MTETQTLLADFVQNGSEPAFRELVARYLGLVYSTAVRLMDGDTQRAEDVSQIVFADLAKMAGKLSAGSMLGGWLHRHTCFVARNVMRPSDIQRDNPNCIGGDITGGAQSLRRMLFPRVSHRTPVDNIFLCSSTTPPGPGVHGMCGVRAANLAIKSRGLPPERHTL